jgi:hypothetical protein
MNIIKEVNYAAKSVPAVTCGLLKNCINSSDHMASDEKMTNEMERK